jgi:hypothetical protein
MAAYAAYQTARWVESATGAGAQQSAELLIQNRQYQAAEEARRGEFGRQMIRQVGVGTAARELAWAPREGETLSFAFDWAKDALGSMFTRQKFEDYHRAAARERYEDRDLQRMQFMNEAAKLVYQEGMADPDIEKAVGMRTATAGIQALTDRGFSAEATRRVRRDIAMFRGRGAQPSDVAYARLATRFAGMDPALVTQMLRLRSTPDDAQWVAAALTQAGGLRTEDILGRQTITGAAAGIASTYGPEFNVRDILSGMATGQGAGVAQVAQVMGVPTNMLDPRYVSSVAQGVAGAARGMEATARNPQSFEYTAGMARLMQMGIRAPIAQLFMNRGFLTNKQVQEEVAKYTNTSTEQVTGYAKAIDQARFQMIERSLGTPEEVHRLEKITGMSAAGAFMVGDARDAAKTQGAKGWFDTLFEEAKVDVKKVTGADYAQQSTEQKQDEADAAVQSKLLASVDSLPDRISEGIKKAAEDVIQKYFQQQQGALAAPTGGLNPLATLERYGPYVAGLETGVEGWKALFHLGSAGLASASGSTTMPGQPTMPMVKRDMRSIK